MAKETVIISKKMLNELLKETYEKEALLRHKVKEDMDEINWNREPEMQEVENLLEELTDEVSYKTYNGRYKYRTSKEIIEEIMAKIK